jgi:hypothetical protein
MKIKKSFLVYSLPALVLVLLLTSNCRKDEKSAPQITTSPISNVAITSVTCGGKVTSKEGIGIIEQGVCFGTAPGPTISNNKLPASGTIGKFTSKVTGLTAATKYYLRAYAINSAGTSYGEEMSFITHRPLSEGSMSGCFNNVYHTFTRGIEEVQPVDSFSNCYFYEDCKKHYDDICHGPMKQINLIRRDSTLEVDIFISGISPDSLPAERPILNVFCRYAEIQCYNLYKGYRTPSGNEYRSRSASFMNGVIINDSKDDVLSGTFEGDLVSAAGDTIRVAGGEFKIRIVRKRLDCWHE